MRHTPERHTDAADRTVKDIRRKTHKRYSSEDKIRIVLAGLRGARNHHYPMHGADPILETTKK